MREKQQNINNRLLLWLFVFLALTLIFIFTPEADKQLIFAQELEVDYPDIPGAGTPTPSTSLPDYVKYIFNFSLIVAGLVAFGALVYGGMRYLTSAGTPAAMSLAKEQIFAGFLSLVILLSSYIILTTINPQLVNFSSINLTPTTITPATSSVPVQEEEDFVFFQIPTGKIIERALLSQTAIAKTKQAKTTAQALENSAKNLKNLVGQLRDFSNSCVCGNSQCSSINVDTGAGCFGQACPWAVCDIARRDNIINDIEAAIEDLETKQNNVADAQLSLAEDYSELEVAGLLMSLLHGEIEDYNTMLIDRYLIEESQEVKFEYSLPTWQDIKVAYDDHIVNDPATFYFNKAGNEEAVEIAQSFVPNNLPSPNSFGQTVAPYMSVPSVEVTTDIIDFGAATYYQNIGAWKNQVIDACASIKQNQMWYSGCGLTSIATAIAYLNPASNITPAEIAQIANTGSYRNAFICSNGNNNFGTVLGTASKIAEDYNISVSSLFYSFEQANAELQKGNPVVVSCGNFLNKGYAHIIVLKGIKDGYIWIHDPAGYWVNVHNGKLSPTTYSQWNCGRRYVSFEKQ